MSTRVEIAIYFPDYRSGPDRFNIFGARPGYIHGPDPSSQIGSSIAAPSSFNLGKLSQGAIVN